MTQRIDMRDAFPGLIVRQALPEDWLGILDLREEVLDEPWGREILTEPSPEDLYPDNITTVAIFEGSVIATARLDRSNELEGTYIGRRVATHRIFRHMGLGSTVVRLAEQEARFRGGNKVMLDARTNLDPLNDPEFDAVPFYQHLGYTTTQHIVTWDGHPHRQMWKDL